MSTVNIQDQGIIVFYYRIHHHFYNVSISTKENNTMTAKRYYNAIQKFMFTAVVHVHNAMQKCIFNRSACSQTTYICMNGYTSK